MSSTNTGIIVGNIVSDIEVKNPNDSMTVANFRVAPVDAMEGDSPIPVTAYNGMATAISSRYNKGDLLSLTHRLRYVTWQTPEGEYRGRMEVVVTGFTAVRLGQITTAARAAAAAQPKQQEQPAAPVPASTPVRTRVMRKAAAPAMSGPGMDDIPF